jgi:hypothetical protein
VHRGLGARRLNKGQSRDGNREGIWEWNGRRATGKAVRSDGTHTIETFDCGGELLTLHSFKKKLGNVFTTLFILCRNGRLGLLFLVLVMHGAEAIVGIHLLVLRFGVFCLDFPNALILERERAPAVTYDLGKGSVVGFDRSRNVLLTNEIGTEQHERVGGTRDVALGATLSGRAALARRRGGSDGGREEG